jgi:two-component system OmpR family sensor kinase
VAALEPPEHTGARLLLALATALPVALAVAIGGAILIARRGLAPLERVVRTAERVSAERLTERIESRPDDVDEAARLVSAVNAMLDRLERSVGGMRRFSADASHELRTPLAALMGELEVTLRQPRSEAALRGVAESTLEELGRMARLVEALLTLARSDASALPVAAADLELDAVVRQSVAPYEAVLAGRGIALRCQIEPLGAHADPLLVNRIVANLLDNACKFTPGGGAVEVSLSLDHGRPTVHVRDSGPGISDGERVFERFYRGEQARAGSDGFGLGLPLARELARALGGEVRLLPSESGAHFALELPASGGGSTGG